MKKTSKNILVIFSIFIILLFNINFIFSMGDTYVTTCEQLQNMNLEYGHYRLNSDIDCSDTINWNSGAGFLPLGNLTDPFTSSFLFLDYKISNLFINVTSDSDVYAGLFGYYDGYYDLDDVVFENITIIAKSTNGNVTVGSLAAILNTDSDNVVADNIHIEVEGQNNINIGGLFGNNDNYLIENINLNNVEIIQNSSSNLESENSSVGGIVGNLVDSSLENSNVKNITINSTSLGSSVFVGGLVGNSQGSSQIEKSYLLNADLYGKSLGVSSDVFVGGVFGKATTVSDIYARNVIAKSYSTTDGFANSGGIAGEITSSLTNSYAIVDYLEAKSINGENGNKGLLLGKSNSGNLVYNSYSSSDFFSSSLIGLDFSTNENLNYLSDEKMKYQFYYDGFDFSNVWNINVDANDGYPNLGDEEIDMEDDFSDAFLVQNSTNINDNQETNITCSLLKNPTIGNLLVTSLATSKNAGSYSIPEGFTLINQYIGADVSGALAYKVSNGTEDSIVWNQANSNYMNCWIGEYSGINNIDPFDVFIEDINSESSISSLTSFIFPTTLEEKEYALSFFAIDSSSSAENSREWSSGFNELIYSSDNSIKAGLSMAERKVTRSYYFRSGISWLTSDESYMLLSIFRMLEKNINLDVVLNFSVEDNCFENYTCDLNYTVKSVNELDKCWYTNFNEILSIQTPLTNWSNVVINDGYNFFRVYCNDTLNNTNSDDVIFYYGNSTEPDLEKPDPEEPDPDNSSVYLEEINNVYYFDEYKPFFKLNMDNKNINGILLNATNESFKIKTFIDKYISLGFFLKFEDMENRYILVSDNLTIQLYNNNLKIKINTLDEKIFLVPIDKSWTHIGLSIGNEIQIYKNGKLINEDINENNFTTNDIIFNINNSRIDEFEMYRSNFMDFEKMFLDKIEEYAIESFQKYKEIEFDASVYGNNFLLEFNNSFEGYFFEKHGSKYYQLPSCEYNDKIYVKIFDQYDNEYIPEVVGNSIIRRIENESKIYYFYQGIYETTDKFKLKNCTDVFGTLDIDLEDYNLINSNIDIGDIQNITYSLSDVNDYFALEEIEDKNVAQQDFYFDKNNNCDYYFNGEEEDNFLENGLYLNNNYVDIICSYGYKTITFTMNNSNPSIEYKYKEISGDDFKIFLYTNDSIYLDKDKIDLEINGYEKDFSYRIYGNLHIIEFDNENPGLYNINLKYDNNLIFDNQINIIEKNLNLNYEINSDLKKNMNGEYYIEEETHLYINSDNIENKDEFIALNSSDSINIGFSSFINQNIINSFNVFVVGYNFIKSSEEYSFPFYLQYIGRDNNENYFYISNNPSNYYVIE